MKLSNDKIFTPQWVVEDMVKYFSPHGKILDPCRGDGAFTNVIPNVLWCEIDEGVDFFNWSDKVDWIISNPPFSKLRKFILHSFKVSDNIVFLVPVWKVFMAYGLIKEAAKFGGIKEIRWYGTGSTLGFPMGNGIGAVYWKRNYKGSISQTFYEASEVE
tara:strand:+ start:2270 stop:2746 length:477 start_codon:yes stop_codon:yes gene_type:complete